MLLESGPDGPVSVGGQRCDLVSFDKDQLNLVMSSCSDTGVNWKIH